MRLIFEARPSWPPLTWLATCSRDELLVHVQHGPGVETGAEHFCEAVWNGEFAAADFDRTDLVFGSGGRLRHSEAVFVSSGSSVDRLHSLERDACVLVSNSMPCLLAAARGGADLRYPGYRQDIATVVDGQEAYRRTIPSTAGPVRLTCFRNLIWDGSFLRESEKPGSERSFRAYADYRSFLDEAIARCLANARDPARRVRFDPLGTLSRGYSSPTVAALARPHGLEEVVSLVAANDRSAEDAAGIANVLGVRMLPVARDAWRERPLAEVPFLAVDGRGEDVFLAGAHDHLRHRVLMTGFHGDTMWDKWTPFEALNPTLRRRHPSGMTLGEYRLWRGFIHLPVPFMGARAIADVHRISVSDELAPWDIGGRYTRPFCRRVVEEAGVPREAFGMKKVASVRFNSDERRYTAPTCEDHRRWSRATREAWLAGGHVPPEGVDRLLEVNLNVHRFLIDAAVEASRLGAHLWHTPFHWIEDRLDGHRHRYAERLRRHGLYRSMFAWALERSKQRYALTAEEAAAPVTREQESLALKSASARPS